jgi:periplasmic protein TonB
VVRFTITRDGRVVSVDLVSGSGSASLDDAAQAMLRGATLPPFPSVLPEAQIAVTLPIRYSLEQ